MSKKPLTPAIFQKERRKSRPGRELSLPSNIFHLTNNRDSGPSVKGSRTIRGYAFFLAFAAVSASIASLEAEEPDTSVFVAARANGLDVKGRWHALQNDWSARVGDNEGTRIDGAQLVSLRRFHLPLPPPPSEDHFLLANGDCIPIQQLRLAEEKFSFRHPRLAGGKETSLPLAAVALLWHDAPAKTRDVEKLYRRLRTGKRTRDVVCLLNGDTVAGTLIGMDKGNIEIEVEKRRVALKRTQLAYLAFNTELTESPQPKGVFARLTLTDGSRMTLTSATSDAAKLTATTAFGARLSAPLTDTVALDLFGGCCTYLSDLKEGKYEFQPYLDADWPYAVNGNVAEHPLRLGGSTYDRGVSMHSRSRLSYALNGAYRHFEALVGLDEIDGRDGSVRLRVLADGKPLIDRALTGRDGAVPIRLSVKGARTLTLEVDFGENGDVCDVVDWCDARLIK